MAFAWKQKLKDGKAKAGTAFAQAVESSKQLVVKADEKLVALDGKIQDGTVKLVNKVEEKVLALRKKKDAPKSDAPKN